MKRRKFLKLASLWFPAAPFIAEGQFTFTDGPYLAASAPDANANLLTGLQLALGPGHPGGGTCSGNWGVDYSVNNFGVVCCNTSVTDATGPGNVGTTGAYVGAAWIARKEGRLYLLDDAKLKFGSHQSGTISMWVNLQDNINNTLNSPFYAKWGATNEFFLGIGGTPGQAIWLCVPAGGGGNVTLNVGSGFALNTWYHVVVGYDDSSGMLFQQVNAGTRTTAAITNGIAAGTNQPTVFSYSPNPDSTCSNSLPADANEGQLCFWQRALSTGEVTQLFNGGNGLSLPF